MLKKLLLSFENTFTNWLLDVRIVVYFSSQQPMRCLGLFAAAVFNSGDIGGGGGVHMCIIFLSGVCWWLRGVCRLLAESTGGSEQTVATLCFCQIRQFVYDLLHLYSSFLCMGHKQRGVQQLVHSSIKSNAWLRCHSVETDSGKDLLVCGLSYRVWNQVRNNACPVLCSIRFFPLTVSCVFFFFVLQEQ